MSRFLLFLCLAVGFLSSMPSFAQEGEGRYKLDFYGHAYSVRPEMPVGAQLSFEQVRAFIPKNFPDYREVEFARIETIDFAYSIMAGHKYVYEQGVKTLVLRLIDEGEFSWSEKEALSAELRDVFARGLWQDYSKRFVKEGSAGFVYHMAVVQEQYLRFLSCVYLYNMLINSPEGVEAIAEAGFSEKSLKNNK